MTKDEVRETVRDNLDAALHNGYNEYLMGHKAYTIVQDMISTGALPGDLDSYADAYNYIMEWKRERIERL
jgi:hypothetical protein